MSIFNSDIPYSFKRSLKKYCRCNELEYFDTVYFFSYLAFTVSIVRSCVDYDVSYLLVSSSFDDHGRVSSMRKLKISKCPFCDRELNHIKIKPLIDD